MSYSFDALIAGYHMAAAVPVVAPAEMVAAAKNYLVRHEMFAKRETNLLITLILGELNRLIF